MGGRASLAFCYWCLRGPPKADALPDSQAPERTLIVDTSGGLRRISTSFQLRRIPRLHLYSSYSLYPLHFLCFPHSLSTAILG
jgi:hypothetical protein